MKIVRQIINAILVNRLTIALVSKYCHKYHLKGKLFDMIDLSLPMSDERWHACAYVSSGGNL